MHHILCLNAGSSSLKFALYAAGRNGQQLLFHGAVEDIGGAEACRIHWSRDDKRHGGEQPVPGDDMDHALDAVFACLRAQSMPLPQVVGHRVVHGGPDHRGPEVLGPELLASLHELVPLAPLHLPGALAGIEAVTRRLPEIFQVACFDTAFHRRMPEIAQRYPLPRQYWQDGIRRYGFHGLSYEYIVMALGERAAGRVVVAHLGNGASMAACRDGEPMDTTMGMTPTGGLMMGTRSGDMDPGVLLYLLRHGFDTDGLEALLNRHAGLTGVSGLSEDMQTLLRERQTNDAARLAVDLYVYLARKQLGAMAAVLGGVDRLVFTGGVGEHAAPVRADICNGLGYLGIVLDDSANDAGDPVISAQGSACEVRVMAADEDWMIARHAFDVYAREHDYNHV